MSLSKPAAAQNWVPYAVILFVALVLFGVGGVRQFDLAQAPTSLVEPQ